jgi:hypothetical protein
LLLALRTIAPPSMCACSAGGAAEEVTRSCSASTLGGKVGPSGTINAAGPDPSFGPCFSGLPGVTVAGASMLMSNVPR